MYFSQAYAQTTVIDKKGTRIIVRDSTTADNGLTMTAKNIQLGGSLIQSTTLTQNSQILTIATGGSALNITGLIIQSDKLTILSASFLIAKYV